MPCVDFKSVAVLQTVLGMHGRGQQDPTASPPAQLLLEKGRLQPALCKAVMKGHHKVLLSEQDEHDRHHMDLKGARKSPELH